MSVEKRVKPSAQMVESAKSQRKPILTILIATICIVTVAFVVYTLYMRSVREKQQSLEFTATRMMLSSKATYDGSWIEEEHGIFEVYFPSAEPDTTRDYHSIAVSVERDIEYDNATSRAFGVLVGADTFGFNIEDDPMTVLQSVQKQLTSDVVDAYWGYGGSGAYDIDLVDFANGQKAVKVSGDIIMYNLLRKNEESDEIEQEENKQPVLAYITLQRQYPVVIWATWDPQNYLAANEVPTQLTECLATLWQSNSKTGGAKWEPIPTTVDENGYTVFLESSVSPDTDSSSEPADDSDIAMIVEPAPEDETESPEDAGVPESPTGEAEATPGTEE